MTSHGRLDEVDGVVIVFAAVGAVAVELAEAGRAGVVTSQRRLDVEGSLQHRETTTVTTTSYNTSVYNHSQNNVL